MNRESTARHLYTWDDYRSWDDDQRWELIGGEAYAMAPAPLPRHQQILGCLHRALGDYFDGKRCRVWLAPIDVKLSKRDVVQPDLVVVCDPKQVKRTHIEGAPTLVIEILSASTALHDRTLKLRLYARSRVKEVWLVTPYPWLIEVLLLENGSYRLAGAYTRKDRLKSPTFSDLALPLNNVFDFPLEPGEEVLMVKEGRPPYGRRH